MTELINLLKMLINYQNRMKTIHWNVHGKQFDRIHNVSDEYAEMFGSMIDTCGEIIKFMGGKTPSMKESAIAVDQDVFDSTDFTIEESWKCMARMISQLIQAYNKALATPNLLEGIKSKLGDDQYTLIVEYYKMQQRAV